MFQLNGVASAAGPVVSTSSRRPTLGIGSTNGPSWVPPLAAVIGDIAAFLCLVIIAAILLLFVRLRASADRTNSLSPSQHQARAITAAISAPPERPAIRDVTAFIAPPQRHTSAAFQRIETTDRGDVEARNYAASAPAWTTLNRKDPNDCAHI